MSARDEILTAVREAVRDAPRGQPPGPQPTVPPTDRSAMLERFAALAADYRATVIRCKASEVSVHVLKALRDARRVILPAGLPEVVVEAVSGRLGKDAVAADAAGHAELEGFDAVVTTCAAGIAATGTVVLDHGEGQGRRALTLLPDLHVCIVRSGQVVPDVPDAVRRLDPQRPQTWISGPSATSDIELSRVEGVHGPRTLVVLLVGDR
ncbi:lactate utilization protein C [Janibacter sp. Soil728]|uniref:LutC/YkgG family protein n=1 Tax=Janibacter sp. Soil728 TaxID=1736393 RepID=UPI0006F9DAFE|nr:LUD domain-containing protein [Janibacter sp. Soil728]KRE37665.1 lactate utilization protein C [Janibacter sp. Soil728]